MRPAVPRRLLALATVVAAAVAAVVVLTRGPAASSAPARTAAESWSLPRLDGPGSVSLAAFRGRPLVVDFFASWCTACRDELPELLGVSRTAGGRVAFVGVDSEENGDGLAMARTYGITAWPLARDVGGTQQSGLRDAVEHIAGMPVIALYDAQGRLALARLGAVSAETLRELLARSVGVSLSP